MFKTNTQKCLCSICISFLLWQQVPVSFIRQTLAYGLWLCMQVYRRMLVTHATLFPHWPGVSRCKTVIITHGFLTHALTAPWLRTAFTLMLTLFPPAEILILWHHGIVIVYTVSTVGPGALCLEDKLWAKLWPHTVTFYHKTVFNCFCAKPDF